MNRRYDRGREIDVGTTNLLLFQSRSLDDREVRRAHDDGVAIHEAFLALIVDRIGLGHGGHQTMIGDVVLFGRLASKVVEHTDVRQARRCVRCLAPEQGLDVLQGDRFLWHEHSGVVGQTLQLGFVPSDLVKGNPVAVVVDEMVIFVVRIPVDARVIDRDVGCDLRCTRVADRWNLDGCDLEMDVDASRHGCQHRTLIRLGNASVAIIGALLVTRRVVNGDAVGIACIGRGRTLFEQAFGDVDGIDGVIGAIDPVKSRRVGEFHPVLSEELLHETRLQYGIGQDVLDFDDVVHFRESTADPLAIVSCSDERRRFHGRMTVDALLVVLGHFETLNES